MAVDTVGPVLLDELEQAWVDEEFGAIIAANFDDEYAGPPERPTSNGGRWSSPTQELWTSTGSPRGQDRLRTPLRGQQRSPPRWR